MGQIDCLLLLVLCRNVGTLTNHPFPCLIPFFAHSGVWTISGSPLDLHDPRLLAMATAERHLLATEYDDYDANASGSTFYRFAALIVSSCNRLMSISKDGQ